MTWLKLSTGILQDSKIKLVRKHPDGDALFVLWVAMLCLAMEQQTDRLFIADGVPFEPADLSALFDIEEKTVRLGLALFQRFGMITIEGDGGLVIENFKRHQSLEKIEDRRGQWRAAQQKKRGRLLEPCQQPVNTTSTECQPKEVEEEEEKEKEYPAPPVLSRNARREAELEPFREAFKKGPTAKASRPSAAFPVDHYLAVETAFREAYVAERIGDEYLGDYGADRTAIKKLFERGVKPEMISAACRPFLQIGRQGRDAEYWAGHRTIRSLVRYWDHEALAKHRQRAGPDPMLSRIMADGIDLG